VGDGPPGDSPGDDNTERESAIEESGAKEPDAANSWDWGPSDQKDRRPPGSWTPDTNVPRAQFGEFGDNFKIKTLMDLAGYDLDEEHPLKPGTTMRSLGGEVHVTIAYTNDQPWNGFNMHPWSRGPVPHYTYSFERRPVASKIDKESFEPDANVRTHQAYTGMRVIVKQDAEVVQWDHCGFLLMITTYVVLTWVSQAILDAATLYLSPNKEEYRSKIYEDTIPPPDFVLPEKTADEAAASAGGAAAAAGAAATPAAAPAKTGA